MSIHRYTADTATPVRTFKLPDDPTRRRRRLLRQAQDKSVTNNRGRIARSRVCFIFADGHNVDPVDVGRLLFQVRLDAPDKCRYLVAAKIVGDVDAHEDPYLARSHVGNEEFANGGDPGVGEEEGPHSVPVGRWDRLAEQEVVVALDEAKADADEHQCDKHRFRSLSL